MSSFIAFVKLVGGPGSLRLLAILFVAGALWGLAWPKRPKAAAVGLAVVVAVYVVMALPAVASTLMAALPQTPARDTAPLREVKTIFFIDGDNRFGRLREFERLYAAAHPERVYLLGRLSVYKDLLLMPNVDRRSLHHEPDPANTTAQLARVEALLRAGAPQPCALLVSSLQYPRVERFVRGNGLPCLLAAGPLDEDLPSTGFRQWVPSLAALAATRDTLYELAALQYYD